MVKYPQGLVALTILALVGLSRAQQSESLSQRHSAVARSDYDNSWLTTILVIAIPLILIPYILFLFTSIPYGGGHHGGHYGGGYGHGGGHGGGGGGHGGGWGWARSNSGSKAKIDDVVAKRVLTSI